MIFTNKNGNQINVIESEYNKKIFKKAGIIISVHGIGSHFQNIGLKYKYDLDGRSLFFSKLNMLSFAIELEGHGLSQGERCCIFDFNSLVDDLKQLILILKDKYNSIPIYLIGFSMGGAIIINLGIKYPNLINGVILMAPMCGISDSMKPSLPVEYILKLLLIFFPKQKWVPGSDKDFVKKCSKNKEFQLIKKSDNVSYKDNHRLTTAFQCLTACDFIKMNSSLFSLPLLLFHGDSDLVTDYKISQEFFNNIKSSDKKFVTLEDGYHNLLIQSDNNDLTPEIIMNHIKNWLDLRVDNDLEACRNSEYNKIIDNTLIVQKKNKLEKNNINYF